MRFRKPKKLPMPDNVRLLIRTVGELQRLDVIDDLNNRHWNVCGLNDYPTEEMMKLIIAECRKFYIDFSPDKLITGND